MHKEMLGLLALACALSVWTMMSPVLMHTEAVASTAVGDQLVSENYLDGVVTEKITYEGFDVATQGEPDTVILLLPTSAEGVPDFDPITPQEVAEYLAWSGKTAAAWAAELDSSALPVAWYMSMAQSFDDAQTAQDLFDLLGTLGQKTAINEYLSFHSFIETADVSAKGFTDTLDKLNITLPEFFARLENDGTSFEAMSKAYFYQYQKLDEFLDFNGTMINSNIVITGATIMAVLTVAEVAIDIIEAALDILEAIFPSTDVQIKDFQTRMLSQSQPNPIHYSGNVYGQSKIIAWKTSINGKMQSNVEFLVSSVRGATLTGKENMGPVYLPSVHLRHYKGEADDGWVLKTIDTKMLQYGATTVVGGKTLPAVETYTGADGRTYPVYYVQTTYQVKRGGDSIPKSYTFKIWGDKAPNVIQ